MDTGKPRISACMVLYNAGEEALKAVECLEKSDVNVDLYLVDNSPTTSSTAAQIAWKYPGVKVLKQDRNLGFGRGNNVVLPLLESEYHLLINPDVTFEPDLLSRMIAYMDARPNAAILTPRVFSEDGEEQFLPKRQPTIRYLLGGFLEKLGKPFKQWRAEYTLQDEHVSTPIQVQFATGCFLLIRTEIFDRLNGFDERFFLYQEDSDLSRRVLESNIGPIIYHPDMHVTHAWKRENTRTLKGTMRQIVSVCKFFGKWGIKW
ncbi:MAG: glycosyltransferase family 2 protein [Clostridia bacterium]|nr:glycosyltransferase family 2 protein [Clostridia bacterium]